MRAFFNFIEKGRKKERKEENTFNRIVFIVERLCRFFQFYRKRKKERKEGRKKERKKERRKKGRKEERKKICLIGSYAWKFLYYISILILCCFFQFYRKRKKKKERKKERKKGRKKERKKRRKEENTFNMIYG